MVQEVRSVVGGKKGGEGTIRRGRTGTTYLESPTQFRIVWLSRRLGKPRERDISPERGTHPEREGVLRAAGCGGEGRQKTKSRERLEKADAMFRNTFQSGVISILSARGYDVRFRR